MKFSELIKISRPRFWLYTAGTFAVGASFGAFSVTDFLRLDYWLWLLCWLVPANIFLYGVNDLADRDTDKFNSKKSGKEVRYSAQRHQHLKNYVLLSLLIAAALLLVLPAVSAFFTLMFFALGWAYSAPPLRLKARPLVDSASNVLYAMPGIAGYTLMTSAPISISAVLAAWAWTWSMHLFSAIPDISADHKAGLNTTAVALGRQRSLLLCMLLWVLAAGFSWVAGLPLWYSLLAGAFYLGICLFLFIKDGASVIKAYWYFPFLNFLVGTSMFFLPWI